MTEKTPADQVIREMIADACPDAPDQTVREATAAVLQVGMHRAPTAEDAETFRRQFADALRGAAPQMSEDAHAALGRSLKRRYDNGASIKELSELTGRSYGFVHRLLSEAGTDLLGQGGAARGNRDERAADTTADARRTGTEPAESTVQGRPLPGPPTHDQLLVELRALRVRGLADLRTGHYPALSTAALSGGFSTELGQARGTETLLREAVRRLGQGTSLDGQAAAHTFGLLPGRRDDRAHDRRRNAAMVYGISIERFRKGQEIFVLQQLADAILSILHERQSTPGTTTSQDPATDNPGSPALPSNARGTKK